VLPKILFKQPLRGKIKVSLLKKERFSRSPELSEYGQNFSKLFMLQIGISIKNSVPSSKTQYAWVKAKTLLPKSIF
jgi:hypothetical protein